MTQGHVVDVDKDLAALLVPYLAAGVAGVGEDGADGRLGPRPAAVEVVPVAGRVVGAGGGDTVARETLGDAEKPSAGQVLGEDPLDDRGGRGVDFQAAEPLAVEGLAGVGVGAGVGQPVAVGRAAPEEAALADP